MKSEVTVVIINISGIFLKKIKFNIEKGIKHLPFDIAQGDSKMEMSLGDFKRLLSKSGVPSQTELNVGTRVTFDMGIKSVRTISFNMHPLG